MFSILGQTNLEFAIDREKCAKWNVSIADVQDALATAVGGKAFTEMVEGERTFDITLRWPERLRMDENQILDIPVDVIKNRVEAVEQQSPGQSGDHRQQRDAARIDRQHLSGTAGGCAAPASARPGDAAERRRASAIRTRPSRAAALRRSIASKGERLIAVKFSVRGRDLASAVAEAQDRTSNALRRSYRAEWSGEFEEMENAAATGWRSSPALPWC